MSHTTSLEQLIACQLCDAIVTIPPVKPGEKASCPCCGATLVVRKRNTINRTLAVSLSGLLLFFPATQLPLIGISAAGQYNDASLFECITLLVDKNFPIVAFCVFLFTIAIPCVRLFSAFYLAYCVKRDIIKPSLLVFFRSYQLLDSWTMIHVFFLGVIVSMYKLIELAELTIGGGLFSLVLLLICSTFVSITLDQPFFWNTLEKNSD